MIDTNRKTNQFYLHYRKGKLIIEQAEHNYKSYQNESNIFMEFHNRIDNWTDNKQSNKLHDTSNRMNKYKMENSTWFALSNIMPNAYQ